MSCLWLSPMSWVGGELDKNEVVLHEDRLIDVVEGYFLISEAYKRERFAAPPCEPPHLTEPAKIAAFTALAIMTFKPFRYVDPSRPVQQISSFVANQTFALLCAASVLSNDFSRLSFDMERRLNNYLQWVNVAAVADYVADQLVGARKDIYIVDLAASGFTSASGIVAGFPQYDHRNSDLPTIDMLVLFFELFWNGDPVDGAGPWNDGPWRDG